MSQVFSFRLNSNNPREARAKEVILVWTNKGHNLRYIISEALLHLENYQSESINILDITKTIDRLSNLLERIENQQEGILINTDQKSDELSKAFKSSIMNLINPGLQAED